MGVEPDTAMRDRPQPRPNSKPHNDLQVRAIPMARFFTPTDLDLDDLAEAIRLLLGPDQVPPIDGPDRPDSHLLSVPRRVSHVLEATGTH